MRPPCLLLAAGLVLAACGPPPAPVPHPDPEARLLLIGLDGAAWDEMLPLLRAGDLPHLEALMRAGTAARLTTMAPALSPVIWTTIATGKLPAQHGITGFLAREPETGERVPVTSNLRRARALWGILGEAGIQVGVVGWWATWPAEEVNGWMISPYAAPGQTTWKGSVYVDGRRDQTWPRGYLSEVADDIQAGVGQAERDFEDLFPVPAGMEFPDYLRAYLKDTRWVHVSDTIFVRLGARVLRDHRPRFMAVYLGGVDVCGHRFRRFAHPGQGGWTATDPQIRVFGPALANYYRWTDQAVGELVAAAPRGTTVMVVSDHGMQAAPVKRHPPTPWNLFPQEISGGHVGGPDGIFILSGPGAGRNFDPGWWDHGAGLPRLGTTQVPGVVDITPTVLHFFGLPVGRDMKGSVLSSILAPELAARPVTLRATWEDPSRLPDPTPIRSPRMDEVKTRLESLGYINGD
ncbi:MAG: alkaline phosphatase family protein [Acidobacteriota bacterium]